MEWIIDNWELFVAMACAICCVIESVICFVLEPKQKKKMNVREWLLYAVVEAERKLGSGTGALKLRYVYDLAITKFPWLPKVVTFDTFSDWVDDALVWMETQLGSNKNVQEYVNDVRG